MADFNVTITLSTRFCGRCGLFYALPSGMSTPCPGCSGRAHESEMHRIRSQRDEALHAAATYKGQNTRLRNLLNAKV